jgi:hypothetical protein
MNTSSILFTTDQLGKLLEQLLPASSGLCVHQLLVAADALTLLIASTHGDGVLSSLWAIDRTGA